MPLLLFFYWGGRSIGSTRCNPGRMIVARRTGLLVWRGNNGCVSPVALCRLSEESVHAVITEVEIVGVVSGSTVGKESIHTLIAEIEVVGIVLYIRFAAHGRSGS